MQLPFTTSEMETYIRQAARARGIDPDIAVRVARSEGLAPNTWQANYRRRGYREPSYGPFQLLEGGAGTGFPRGMGNDFRRATGMDPSDPANAYAGVDFALDQAARGGWGPWYGAAKAGIGRRTGLQGAQPIGVIGQPGASPELTAFANAIENRPFTGGLPVDSSAMAIGNMNVTAAPIPAPRRNNPANPSFADNAVGNLQNRDYGYFDNIPTVSMLMGALGGPAPNTVPAERISQPFQVLDRGVPSVAATDVSPDRISAPFEAVQDATQSRVTPERISAPFEALERVDQGTGTFAPAPEDLSPPISVPAPPTVTDPVSSTPNMGIPQARPYEPQRIAEPPGALRRAGRVARAILPQSLPARAATLAGGVLGGPVGMIAGRVAGGGLNSLMQGRAPMISVGGESFNRTPLGQATQAGRQGGGFNNPAFTRGYAAAGGSDDPRSYGRALAEEQRQRSMAGQKTVMDAFGGLFGGRDW